MDGQLWAEISSAPEKPSDSGGWGEIRTHGTLAGTPVFKTGALNHSATHPTHSDLSPVILQLSERRELLLRHRGAVHRIGQPVGRREDHLPQVQCAVPP